jgi:hypothetical protein
MDGNCLNVRMGRVPFEKEQIMALQTFVLLLQVGTFAVAVPGYGSIAECEKARDVAIQSRVAWRGVCLPGPVESR